ncbi:MAG: saccharopine dehydrogenase, partial [Pseudomonadota bacterium]
RENIVKRLVPDQGEGPDEKARESGFFNLVLVGKTHADETIRVRVTGDRDPGYGSTSKMIAESAVCLAKDELHAGGGFWTPASAMHGKLLTRLQANAGLKFDVL